MLPGPLPERTQKGHQKVELGLAAGLPNSVSETEYLPLLPAQGLCPRFYDLCGPRTADPTWISKLGCEGDYGGFRECCWLLGAYVVPKARRLVTGSQTYPIAPGYSHPHHHG